MMQIACALFVVNVMSFVIIISIVPYPLKPGIFYPILYLLMTMLFIFPIWKTQLFLTIIEAVFVCLVIAYKAPNAYPYDIFGSVTVWLLGFVFSFVVLDLRLRENDVRRKLEEISSTDEMTGLPNRRSFNQTIEQIYKSCRIRKEPMAVFMMDIDHFKRYNDCYGHIAGDRCLELLGNTLYAVAEKDQIYICRYGGEEFAAVLHGKQVLDTCRVASTLLQSVQQCAIETGQGTSGHVTISIGIAVQKELEEDSFYPMLRKADAALYFAKKGGRNQAVFYDPEVERQSDLLPLGELWKEKIDPCNENQCGEII